MLIETLKKGTIKAWYYKGSLLVPIISGQKQNVLDTERRPGRYFELFFIFSVFFFVLRDTGTCGIWDAIPLAYK